MLLEKLGEWDIERSEEYAKWDKANFCPLAAMQSESRNGMGLASLNTMGH